MVQIKRHASTEQGTLGELLIDGVFFCYTMELPWKDNESDVSCIPDGKYQVTWRFSESHGRNLYHVEGVSGRSGVEIHPGNTDHDSLGCILLGDKLGELYGQEAVLNSVIAVTMFEHKMNKQPFTLIISWN